MCGVVGGRGLWLMCVCLRATCANRFPLSPLRTTTQLKSAVACMGTALTQEHLRALRNALPSEGTVVLVLDGDSAGVRAAERACRDVLLALEADERMSGLLVKVAELPRQAGRSGKRKAKKEKNDDDDDEEDDGGEEEGGDVKDPADFVLVSAVVWIGSALPSAAYLDGTITHPGIHIFSHTTRRVAQGRGPPLRRRCWGGPCRGRSGTPRGSS